MNRVLFPLPGLVINEDKGKGDDDEKSQGLLVLAALLKKKWPTRFNALGKN